MAKGKFERTKPHVNVGTIGHVNEPLIELALTTAAESIADAKLSASRLAQQTVGVVFGTSKGGLHTFSRLLEDSRFDGRADSTTPEPLTSDDWLHVLPNQAALSISQLIGGYGPILCPVAACATGLAACLRGAELIQNGDCDLVLAGSADASLQPALLASFRRLGVLSRETQDPTHACQPFDRRRTGFVIGEGAACLILERLDSAIARNAKWYAEWRGGRLLSDPYGLTQLDPSGTTLQELLRDMLRKQTQIPDYLNLHGTGTATNDVVEYGVGGTPVVAPHRDGGCTRLDGVGPCRERGGDRCRPGGGDRWK